MLTIEQRIEDYRAILIKEDGKSNAHWVAGIIFGLKLALYINRLTGKEQGK